MLLRTKRLGLVAGRAVAILNEKTAKRLGLHVSERVKLKPIGGKKELTAIVDFSYGLKPNEIALSEEVIKELNLKPGAVVEIGPSLRPISASYILKKLEGKELSYKEIYQIIKDITKNRLTEAEVAYFVSAEFRGMNLEEIASLTKAMLKSGSELKLKKKFVIDKHGIGGVAGNRTTPIVVSIISAFIDKFKLDAVMPKTSSRAITSAAGTADCIETLAKVEFTIPEIKRILNKTNACFVWGGALGLAPADDLIIRVEKALGLDPEAQLIASILSKKLAVHATHVLLDIPYGRSAKVDLKKAKELKSKFERIAKMLKLNLRCILTKTDQPIGRGIGPVLEMMDVIEVLMRKDSRPLDLEAKAVQLAAELINFTTHMPKELAKTQAQALLDSKAALKKFREIISAQKGSLKQLKPAKFKVLIKAKKAGTITEISNKEIAQIARAAGCPADKRAGLFLYKKVSEKVNKKDVLFAIYAETPAKLRWAERFARRLNPFKIE